MQNLGWKHHLLHWHEIISPLSLVLTQHKTVSSNTLKNFLNQVGRSIQIIMFSTRRKLRSFAIITSSRYLFKQFLFLAGFPFDFIFNFPHYIVFNFVVCVSSIYKQSDPQRSYLTSKAPLSSSVKWESSWTSMILLPQHLFSVTTLLYSTHIPVEPYKGPDPLST